jgi:hypothetical protein
MMVAVHPHSAPLNIQASSRLAISQGGFPSEPLLCWPADITQNTPVTIQSLEVRQHNVWGGINSTQPLDPQTSRAQQWQHTSVETRWQHSSVRDESARHLGMDLHKRGATYASTLLWACHEVVTRKCVGQGGAQHRGCCTSSIRGYCTLPKQSSSNAFAPLGLLKDPNICSWTHGGEICSYH